MLVLVAALRVFSLCMACRSFRWDMRTLSCGTRDLVLWPGMESRPLRWEHGVLPPGAPGVPDAVLLTWAVPGGVYRCLICYVVFPWWLTLTHFCAPADELDALFVECNPLLNYVFFLYWFVGILSVFCIHILGWVHVLQISSLVLCLHSLHCVFWWTGFNFKGIKLTSPFFWLVTLVYKLFNLLPIS